MLPLPEEQRRFNRSLASGRPYRTQYFGDEIPVSVRALGRLSSPQFTMMIRPGEYSNSWLNMDEPVPRTPNTTVPNDFDANHPAYQELEQEIMKNGVLRPVIISPNKKNVLIHDYGEKWPNRTPAHFVLDGHHRAFFAIKHGLDIPVAKFVKHDR